ncbi:MAG: PAS domain S-box protein [Bacteroidetes bacterium]|nr:PAS domain S-box protein [Bacteroidota bacterium]
MKSAIEKQNLLEALFINVTESIIVTGQSGDIQLINPATERLFQYTQEELVGKTVECLIPARFAGNHAAHRGKYNTNPHSRSMGLGIDLFAKRKDGSEFPIEISLSPFTAGTDKYVIAFLVDITLRKKAEQRIIENKAELEMLTGELRASNERLEIKVSDRTKVLSEALGQLEKSKDELKIALAKEKELNELKTRFISMASHEFRTPLTTILSSASLIGEYQTTEQHEKREKHVSRIKSAVNNLNDILSDFLSISKIEEGKAYAEPTMFNLHDLASEIKSDISGLLKLGQHIELEYSGATEIYSDKKMLRNIIINLLSNAIKFSDENKPIELQINTGADITKLSIRDYGMGISNEDKKHLFERFFRGKNALNVQGTGLGLNIVANYVELLNGYIEIESELNKGTCIAITLENKQPQSRS